MMNIREHFNMLRETCDWDVVDELEQAIYELQEENEELFEEWAKNVGIDLQAIDEATGEYVIILWSWDMCGD